MGRGATITSDQMQFFKKRQKEKYLAKLEAASAKKSKGGTPDFKPEPTSELKPLDLSLLHEHEKDEKTEMSGLTDTQHCTDSKHLACIVGAMVANTLSYGSTDKHALLIQFLFYFDKLGSKTEDHMIASAHECLPKPASLVPNEYSVDMISPSIQMNIERIAQFVVTVRRRKLFLSSDTSFDELIEYHGNNRHYAQRIYPL